MVASSSEIGIASAPMQITQRQRHDFRRHGVVCLRGALDGAQVDDARQAWEWSVSHPGPLASGLLPGTDGAFQDLCNPDALAVYERLVRELPLADYAAALWGAAPVWFLYEQVFRKQGGAAARTPWHQDTSYLSLDGNHLVAFWISFEPIPRANALEFVRGSHRAVLYNTSRFDPDDPTLPIFPSDGLPNLPDIEARRDAFDIDAFATEPGDIVAFHTSMLHGGAAVDPRTPERRTLTLRFFGDDVVSAARPGPAGPFHEDIRTLVPGEPFRHPRFLQVRGRGGGGWSPGAHRSS